MNLVAILAAAGAGAGAGRAIGGRQGTLAGALVGGLIAWMATTGRDDGEEEGDVEAATQIGTGSASDDALIAQLEPETQELVRNFVIAAKARGFNIYVNNTRRDYAQQKKLWDAYVARGKTPPAVSNPDTNPSSHLFGAGVDIDFLDDDGNRIPHGQVAMSTWKELADLGQSMGLKAGYYFKSQQDVVHFERPDWRTLRDAAAQADA